MGEVLFLLMIVWLFYPPETRNVPEIGEPAPNEQFHWAATACRMSRSGLSQVRISTADAEKQFLRWQASTSRYVGLSSGVPASCTAEFEDLKVPTLHNTIEL